MVPQPFCDNVQHRLCREDASQPRNAGLTLATVTAGYVGGGVPGEAGREAGRVWGHSRPRRSMCGVQPCPVLGTL